jgi:hypothetical protein
MTIDLYTYATPNGHKASIMLEETGWTWHSACYERYKREAGASTPWQVKERSPASKQRRQA